MRAVISLSALLLIFLCGCSRDGNALPIAGAERQLNVSLQTEAAGSQPSLKIVGTAVEGNRLLADVVAVNPLKTAATYEGDPPSASTRGAINPVYKLQTKTAADSDWQDFEFEWEYGTELDQRRLPAEQAGRFRAALDGFMDPEVKTMRVGLWLSWTDASGVRHDEICWSDPITPESTEQIALELSPPDKE